MKTQYIIHHEVCKHCCSFSIDLSLVITSRLSGTLLQRELTHWGPVTHICVTKLILIDSDNGLSPDRRQAIIWTNAGLLLIGPLGTNFSEILIEILTFSFKEMRLKVSSAKWWPFCLGLNVLRELRELSAGASITASYHRYCMGPQEEVWPSD